MFKRLTSYYVETDYMSSKGRSREDQIGASCYNQGENGSSSREHKKGSISRYPLRWNTQGFVHRLDTGSVGKKKRTKDLSNSKNLSKPNNIHKLFKKTIKSSQPSRKKSKKINL